MNAYAKPKPARRTSPRYPDLTAYTVHERDTGPGWQFWVSPTLLAELQALHASGRVEIAWLTTWERAAQTRVEPALGLPRFPVAGTSGGRRSDWLWKARAATEALALHRPIIWTDDEDINTHARDAYAQSGLPHLLITPHPAAGLTPADVAAIRVFAESN